MKAKAAKTVERRGPRSYRGSGKSSPKGDSMAPARKGPTKNSGTPAGDFAEFLLVRLYADFRRPADTQANQARARLSAKLSKQGVVAGVDAIRKWEQGASSPLLKEMNGVAKALGYPDWAELALAVRLFKTGK